MVADEFTKKSGAHCRREMRFAQPLFHPLAGRRKKRAITSQMMARLRDTASRFTKHINDEDRIAAKSPNADWILSEADHPLREFLSA